MNQFFTQHKTILITVGVVFIIILCCIFGIQGSQNKAISLEEEIATCQSDIDVQVNRKVNVLTELVECVKQYDKHEYETLLSIINARVADTDDNSEAGTTNSGATADTTAIINLVRAVAEAYPELKSQANYQKLMDEISITENLLAQYKSTYNTSVKEYNRYCRKFPSRIFLDWTGYEHVDYQYYSTTKTDAEPLNLFGE